MKVSPIIYFLLFVLVIVVLSIWWPAIQAALNGGGK